jgi:hypothetical protein
MAIFMACYRLGNTVNPREKRPEEGSLGCPKTVFKAIWIENSVVQDHGNVEWETGAPYG